MSTIVLRSVKGSPLTNAEVDANFSNLNTDKVEKTAAAITGGSINSTTVGATTPSTGNFTTLTENSNSVAVQTDIGTGPNEIPLNQYLGNLAYQDAANIAGPVGVGGALTLNSGTANGVAYLNGSKVLTTGSALTFNGTSFGIGSSSYGDAGTITASIGVAGTTSGGLQLFASSAQEHFIQWGDATSGAGTYAGAIGYSHASDYMRFYVASAEQMRLTSTGLGIGNSSPTAKLDVTGTAAISGAVTLSGGTANGVAFLNASKVLTTGSALTFDGTNFASTGIITSVNVNGLRAQYPSSAGYYAQLDSRDGNTYLSAVGSTAAIVFRATDGPGTTAEGMRLTSTGLGIGTTSPAQRLDVNGNFRFANFSSGTTSGFFGCADTGSITLNFGGPTTPQKGRIFYSDNSDFFSFFTNSTERMRLDSSGNLGLGVTPSAWSTFGSIIQGQGYALAGFSSGSNVQSALFCNSFFNGSNYIYSSSAAASEYLQISGQHQWYTAPSGTAGNAISFTQAMTLDASGNFMVGATSSSAIANKNIDVNGTGDASFVVRVGGTTTSYLYSTAGTTILGTASTIPLVLQTNNTERARITSGGDFGIGTSTPSGRLTVRVPSDGYTSTANTLNVIGPNDTGFYVGTHFDGGGGGADLVSRGYASGMGDFRFISVNGSYASPTERARITSGGDLLIGTTSSDSTRLVARGTRAAYFNTTFAGNGQDVVNIANSAGSFSYNAIRFWNNALDVGSVIGSISCTTTSTAYNTSSDYRLKNSIAPMTGALAKVALLKPVTYKWNSDGSDCEGFIAHELAEVCPLAVTGQKDAVDAENKPQYQGIDTSFLVATLTAAIQEQQAIITALTARVAALESN